MTDTGAQKIVMKCSYMILKCEIMARPQVADGGNGLQIWRVAVNILNKQSRTADKGWSSNLGVGHGANNSSP
jgi:hypothetical protein